MKFEINTVPFLERYSMPVINMYLKPSGFFNRQREIIKRECDHYTKLYKSGKRNKYNTTKELMKDTFGRQLTTKVYSHRNWIWTFHKPPDKKGYVTLYALVSKRGCYWECDRRSNKEYLEELFYSVLEYIEQY